MQTGKLYIHQEEIPCRWKSLPQVGEPFRAIAGDEAKIVVTKPIKAISYFQGEIIFSSGNGAYRLIPDEAGVGPEAA